MPKKILLADDSVTIQKVVELTFVEEDYEVSCVSNGRAAVEKIKEERPDILLCDVIMPEMNGYEVASFVKRDPGYSSIPVILLTGTFEPFDEDKARSSGADTYITKPFDSKMLVDKVEELLSKRVVYTTPDHEESAQIFHSRQEFVVSSEDQPRAVPDEKDGGSSEESSAFISPELEYEMPDGGLEPLPESSVEQTVISAGRTGEADDLGVASELPSETAENTADSEAQELVLENSDEEVVGQEDLDAEGETTADLGAPRPDEDALSEAVDIGEIMPEDEIPEPAFDELVTPAETAEASEEHLQAEGPKEPGTAGMEPEPATERDAETAAAESFEPTAFEQPFEEIETEEPPPIVHELTAQQEMVSEAQKRLDEEAQLPSEQPSGDATSEAEVEAGQAYERAEPEALSSEEPPGNDKEEPGEEGESSEILEESPFMPYEGEAETVEAASEGDILVAGSRTAAAGFGADAEEEAPGHEAVAAESPEEGPSEEDAAFESGIDTAAPEQAAAAEPPDRVEIDKMVEDALQRLVGPAVERAVNEAVGAAVEKAIGDIASARIDEILGQAVPDAVRESAGRMVPDLGRDILGGILPDMVRQSAGENLPDLVKPIVETEAASAVSRAIEQTLPQAMRQAAQETAPGVVGQVTEEMAPQVIRETVKAISRDLVSEEVKAMMPDIVKPVAWEVIPELAESIIKRRIQELETEETD